MTVLLSRFKPTSTTIRISIICIASHDSNCIGAQNCSYSLMLLEHSLDSARHVIYILPGALCILRVNKSVSQVFANRIWMRYNLTQNDANTSDLLQELCAILKYVTNRTMFFLIHTRCSCHFNFHKLLMNSNLFFIFICYKYILKIHRIACVKDVVRSHLVSDFMFKWNISNNHFCNNLTILYFF